MANLLFVYYYIDSYYELCKDGCNHQKNVEKAQQAKTNGRLQSTHYELPKQDAAKNVPLGTLFLWEAGGICRCKDSAFS